MLCCYKDLGMKGILLVVAILCAAFNSKADSEILVRNSSHRDTIHLAHMEPVQVKTLTIPLVKVIGPYRPVYWGCGCYGYPVTYVDGVPYYKGFLLPLIHNAYQAQYIAPIGIPAQYESKTESIAFR